MIFSNFSVGILDLLIRSISITYSYILGRAAQIVRFLNLVGDFDTLVRAESKIKMVAGVGNAPNVSLRTSAYETDEFDFYSIPQLSLYTCPFEFPKVFLCKYLM